MTITIYPDGHSIQQGTPEELARLVFEMQALQTLQSFRNLVEAIPAEMEKQQKQKDVVVTVPEIPKRGRKQKKRRRRRTMKTKRLIDADDLLIAFGNALNNATLKIGYGFMEWVVNEQPTIDPESLRPTAKWLVVRLMADGAECKCGHCGRHETFTSFDKHTDHVYCCRCGYKMEGLEYERKTAG